MSSIEEVASGLCLKVMEGSHQQEIHDLTRTEISIGRLTPETPYTPAYMTFPEPTLSRLHALLKWDPKAKTYVAHHKSKTNPTLINGRHLKKSVVLTPGDTLALGRLVVVLDIAKNTGSRTEPLNPPPSAILHVNSLTSSRAYSVPVDKPRIKVQFSDTRTTAAITPEENEEGAKTLRIAAGAANELSFSFAENDTATVETVRAEPTTLRCTKLNCGVLSVPLRPGAQLQLLEGDAIRHQEHEARVVKSELPVFSESTLEGKSDTVDSEPKTSTPTSGGALLFLNGAWTGALLEVPETGLTAFELGPKSTSFRHPPPLSNTPTCRITVQNCEAQLRVTRVSDDQFVDVDGELFFAGESTKLSSGSRVLLGEAEFLWSVPSLHEIYSRYEIVEPEGRHPMTKQRLRLGTAAHCEIRFKQSALAPVVGLIEFSEDEIVYNHLNIATPAKVDGVDTSAGLRVQVRAGSKLELAPGVTISIEELR